MQKNNLRLYFLFLVYLIMWSCAEERVEQKPVPILANLSRLESVNGTIPPLDSADRCLVIIYFPKVSCRTCLGSGVERLAQFQQDYDARLTSLLVVYDPLTLAGNRESIYLRNLRRVGQVSRPVLLEGFRGQAGLGPEAGMYLIDLETSRIAGQYLFAIQSDWAAFETEVDKLLSSVIKAWRKP